MKTPGEPFEALTRANKSVLLQELRFQAERLVSPKAMSSLSELTMEDIAWLVYELETHKIELEMQNRELTLTQEALIETVNEYTQLYDEAPIGLLSIDQKGHIQRLNKAASQMLNIPNVGISGKLFITFIVYDDQDVYYIHNRKAMSSFNKESCELRLKTETGEPQWIRLDSICELDPKDDSISFSLALIDISETKDVEP